MVVEQDSPRPCPKLQYMPQIVPWKFNGQGYLANPDPGPKLGSKESFLPSYTNGSVLFIYLFIYGWVPRLWILRPVL